ncbi:MAG: AMP-binding protein, partial [Rhodospirillales bacterium]|nr:AMP-binding protein [Rhodospirillales bacterium]
QAPGIAARAAGRLRGLGVGAGDRVALLCSNRVEFLEILLGCAWLGAVLVPVNLAAKGPQLGHVLTDSGARLLLAETEPAGGVPEGVVVRPVEGFGGDGEEVAEAAVGPGDDLAILYTSGTTGLPKGVCCPHGQLFWWGIHTGRLLGVREGDVLATTLPLFHTNALNTFWQALLAGATMALERRFSASGFWPAMAGSGASVAYLLGAMVPILLTRAPGPEERAHAIRVALAPGVPERFHAPFRARTGIALVDGYGSTETNFVIGTTAERQRAGMMGPVVDGFEARVVDGLDAEVADGVAGELLLRADAPFAFARGYWGMAEQTVAAWRNLWFHTGDMVVRDAGGYFRFVGRIKEAIRRRGENISAIEVEQALLTHPGVAQAAVFAVPAEMGEDEVMACVVPAAGATADAPALAAHCATRLPDFAVPRYIDFAAELPMTENGKVRKVALSARGVTAATWDRMATSPRARAPTG